MNRKRKSLTISILVLLLICSLFAAVYPLFCTWYSERHDSLLQIEYQQELEDSEDESIQLALEEAMKYNRRLAAEEFSVLEYAENGYYDMLNVTGNSIMAFLEIPRINLSMTVYHGTSADVLSKGVGHMEQTSLPTGGESVHAVLSAHTGTTNAPMFTDLVLLEIGDIFYITVLGEKMAYQVDQIKTVLPDDIRDIQIVPGEDLVTLSTCTPYGVNSHRLLVRGRRIKLDKAVDIEAAADKTDVTSVTESVWTQKYVQGILCGLVCAVIFIILAIIVLLTWRRIKHSRKAITTTYLKGNFT